MFQSLLNSLASTNSLFQGFFTAQGSTNSGFQALHTAQAASNTVFRNLFTAQGNTNSGFESRIAARETYDTAQTATNTIFRNLHIAQAATNTAFESRIQDGETAYNWGDHAAAGYLTTGTNLFNGLYSADRSKLGTNLSGLTQGTYTGVLTTVSYTGVTTLALGKLYAWGFTKQNAFGTSTLSIASFSLTRTASGAISNYFVFKGTDTNLVLRLDGDGSSKSDVSGLYLKQITNGTANIAGDLNVGGSIYENGSEIFNPAAHIAATGTNVHGLGDMSLAATSSYYDVSATDILLSGYVPTNDATYTATVAKAASALQGESDTNALAQLAIETSARTNSEYLQGLTNADFEARKVNTNDSRLTDSRSWLELNYNLITNPPAISGDSNAVWGNITGTLANQSDLTSTVAKAASAVQSESDPVYTASVAYAISAGDTSRWNTAGTDASAATNFIGTNTFQAQIGSLETNAYQSFSGAVANDAGGTCTITTAQGSLVRIHQDDFDPATNAITITIPTNGFYDLGVNRIGVELYFTGSVSFAESTITNPTALTISNTATNSLFFRRSGNATLWTGRQ